MTLSKEPLIRLINELKKISIEANIMRRLER